MKNLFVVGLISAIITIASIGTTHSSQQENLFYERMIGQNLTDKGAWIILGKAGNERRNGRCSMSTAWNDGSHFWFIKDLIDDEVYISFQNNMWNISGFPGKYSLRANFIYPDGRVRGVDLEYELVSNNTIMIRWLTRELTEAMYDATELVLILHGRISNALIPLAKTREAMHYLSACIDESKNHKLYDGNVGRSTSGPGTNI